MPAPRNFQRKGRWFIRIAIGTAYDADHYAIGPIKSWSRARSIAMAWEDEHGPNTAHVISRVGPEDDGRSSGRLVFDVTEPASVSTLGSYGTRRLN